MVMFRPKPSYNATMASWRVFRIPIDDISSVNLDLFGAWLINHLFPLGRPCFAIISPGG